MIDCYRFHIHGRVEQHLRSRYTLVTHLQARPWSNLIKSSEAEFTKQLLEQSQLLLVHVGLANLSVIQFARQTLNGRASNSA